MRKILIIIAILNSGYLFSQTKNDISKQIDQFVSMFNYLPITSIFGKEGYEYQSKYHMEWDKKNGVIKIKEIRYEPNSDKKAVDSYNYTFSVSALHKDGILNRNVYGSNTVNLLIYTANNDRMIRKKVYFKQKKRIILYDDRLKFGPWELQTTLESLTEIKELLISIVEMKNVCTAENKPDFSKKISPYMYDLKRIGNLAVDFKYDDGEPVYINSTLENPALITDSKSEKRNRKILGKYLQQELISKGIKISDKILGYIIISNYGRFEAFVPLTIVDPLTLKKLEEILERMPYWKAGVHEGENVRISQVIELKN